MVGWRKNYIPLVRPTGAYVLRFMWWRKVIGTDGLAWFVVGVVSGSVGLTNQSEFVSRIQKVVRGGIGQTIL